MDDEDKQGEEDGRAKITLLDTFKRGREKRNVQTINPQPNEPPDPMPAVTRAIDEATRDLFAVANITLKMVNMARDRLKLPKI